MKTGDHERARSSAVRFAGSLSAAGRTPARCSLPPTGGRKSLRRFYPIFAGVWGGPRTAEWEVSRGRRSFSRVLECLPSSSSASKVRSSSSSSCAPHPWRVVLPLAHSFNKILHTLELLELTQILDQSLWNPTMVTQNSQ